jgi:glycosyltransferase involved in cell wall biosynthesis
MDIFVLTSSTEVFSNAILEAMATGLPIVCSAVGGSVEMVEDGVTGYTFARHDVDGLVGALQELILNSKKRDQFGQCGAAKVMAEFSIESMDRHYAEVISAFSYELGPD